MPALNDYRAKNRMHFDRSPKNQIQRTEQGGNRAEGFAKRLSCQLPQSIQTLTIVLEFYSLAQPSLEYAPYNLPCHTIIKDGLCKLLKDSPWIQLYLYHFP